MRYVTLTPAYGRDYKSMAAVKKDWADGKDFYVTDIMAGSSYANKDTAELKGCTLNIRYKKLTQVCVIKN